MENDIRTEKKQNLIDINLYFKLDFPEQKLKGNRKFEEFKNRKLKEYGKDAKLFFCKNDNIYFYVHIDNCKIFPFFYEQCPLCESYICYFCGRNTDYAIDQIKNEGNCCIKLRLYYLLFYFGLESSKDNFVGVSIVLFFPLICFCFYTSFFIYSFFLGLLLTNKKLPDIVKLYDSRYLDYYSDGACRSLITIIAFLTEFFLLISFTLYDIYFKIILIIISFFTNFRPYKYFVGIIFKGSFSK